MKRRHCAWVAVVVALLVAWAGWATAQTTPRLHPKFHLPATSFAYVGDPARPGTWKLPYRTADGTVDRRRLPLAIAALLGTYRGHQAKIPDDAVPGVLATLGRAAVEIGKLPLRGRHPGRAYRRLADALQARGIDPAR